MVIVATILLFGMLIISTYVNKKIPESISEIAYIFPKWLFSILIMFLGILIMPPILSVINVHFQWLVFFIVAGLWCVASSPFYKSENIFMHYGGAILCFISALAIIVLLNPKILFIWLIYPLCLIKKIRKWWLMIAECLCFLSLMFVLI